MGIRDHRQKAAARSWHRAADQATVETRKSWRERRAKHLTSRVRAASRKKEPRP